MDDTRRVVRVVGIAVSIISFSRRQQDVVLQQVVPYGPGN